MSVTFRLDRESVIPRPDPRCPKCGGEGPGNAGAECSLCLGYGGAPVDVFDAYLVRKEAEEGEFNVANGNARWILESLLNVNTSQEGLWGSLDATTADMRLKSVWNVEDGVEPPSETKGTVLTEEGVAPGALWIYGGRSLEQCERYVWKLRRLVDLALEEGVNVVWG